MTEGAPLNLLVMRNGRHPIAMLVMAACLVTGIMGLVLSPDPAGSIIDRWVPEPWRTVYYVTLVFSGLIVLVGVWLPHIRDRLMVEQIGLWFLSGALMIYPLVIWLAYSQRLGLGGMISLLCGLGCIGRIGEILYELRELDKIGKASRDAHSSARSR